ncbi:hypothetical protein LINPERPRIM_LOCUS38408, partial [Linum perenne]
MSKISNGWQWRWCSRHYVSNYKSTAKCPPMKHRLANLCKKSSMRKFERGVRSFMRTDA